MPRHRIDLLDSIVSDKVHLFKMGFTCVYQLGRAGWGNGGGKTLTKNTTNQIGAEKMACVMSIFNVAPTQTQTPDPLMKSHMC